MNATRFERFSSSDSHPKIEVVGVSTTYVRVGFVCYGAEMTSGGENIFSVKFGMEPEDSRSSSETLLET